MSNENNQILKSDNEVNGSSQLTTEKQIVNDITNEDLNKKKYTKINPTLYIQPIQTDEKSEEDKEKELFKVFNPETNTVEIRELTEEEKHEILVLTLKQRNKKFNPVKYSTKVVGFETITDILGRKHKIKIREQQTNSIKNKFGTKYKQKRNRKNKQTNISRKANRKK